MDRTVQIAVREELRLRKKLVALEYAELCGSVTKACREFEVPHSSFYEWKKAFESGGKSGLVRKKPIPKSHPRSASQDTVRKILDVRARFQLGPERIMWDLERYHGIQISESSV